jgi:voltage-gated potassium channel Kch
MAQACRQSGLSVVYTELLDFDGDEIYFHQEPALVGKTFGEALLAYEDSTLIGLQFGDGRVQLCPPPDTVIQANAQVIVISEDDDTVRLSGLSDYQINQQAIQLAHRQAASPEQTLVLGWNQRGAAIITELDHYVAPGSGITVVADVPEIETEVAAHLAHLVNHNVTCRVGDTTDSTVLKTLNLTQYRHVIVLSYSDTLDPQAADSRTLVTLLHLRHIAETMARPFSIVSEMLDIRNRNLAAVTRADDFIVSDKLVSLMLAQISENKQLAAVFQDLFDAEGVELYLKAASDFVQPGQPVNFYTVVEAARRYGEVAIGYRLAAQADEAERGYGVYLNPPKSNLVTFSADDRVVVLADS